MDKEVVDIFRMERRLDKEERPTTVLIKFISQNSKNHILENTSKLKKYKLILQNTTDWKTVKNLKEPLSLET